MSTTARRSRKGASGHPPKRETVLQLTAQGDLTVLYHIQRTPRPDSVRKMSGKNYNPDKEGVLTVARIVGGKNAGVLHVLDGGTRWRAKSDDPTYLFWTVISPMTEQEAAAATYAFNNEQRHHNAYQSHVIGVAAKFARSLALEEALRRIGIRVNDGSSTRGSIGSIKACERIMSDAYQATFATRDGEVIFPDITTEGRWEMAIQRLVDVLTLTREVYDDWTAHDGDFIQAVGALWSLNEAKFQRATVRRRFVTTLGRRDVPWLRMRAQELRTNYGGSESRGKDIARVIVMSCHNRGLSPDSPSWLTKPRSPRLDG